MPHARTMNDCVDQALLELWFTKHASTRVLYDLVSQLINLLNAGL